MTDFLWLNQVNGLALGGRRRGLNQGQIGMIWAAFACAAILIRFQLGRWLVHWGQLPFYRAGAIVVALCQTCYAVMQPSAPLLLLLRSLEGLALASYFTAVWSRVIDASPPGQVGKTTGLFGISGLCAVLVRLRVGHLSDRWHPKWIIVPSLTLLSAACALLGALKGWPLYPLFLLAGAGVGSAHGMIYPAISNLALQRANSSSNSAAAVFTAAMDLGNLMGCAAAGWLAHYRGHSPVFLALSGMLALGATGVWWLEKDRSGGP